MLFAFLLMGCTSTSAVEERPEEVFSRSELDQMLAPIALYPDPLLSQILMAATYPLEVVEASRWSAANPGLDGAEAVDAVEHMNWDPSVKALVAFPELLARMDDNLQWTQRLGDAYLIQEEDIIDSIQRLREEAYAAGHLNNREYVRAWRDREVIIIEPASPQVVYVPYYQPATIYHHWWRPIYPSFYWGPPLGYHSGLSFYWGHGVRIAPVFFYSTFHWHDRHIVIVDRHHYRPFYSGGGHHGRFNNAQRWSHDPRHRRGVSYSHSGPREQYRHYSASSEGFGRQRDMRDPRRDSVSRDGGYRNNSNRGDGRPWDGANSSSRRDMDQPSGDRSDSISRNRSSSAFNRSDGGGNDSRRGDISHREESRQGGIAPRNSAPRDRDQQERVQRDTQRAESLQRAPSARESGRPGIDNQRRSDQPQYQARPQSVQRPTLTQTNNVDSRQRTLEQRTTSLRESGRQDFSPRSSSASGLGASQSERNTGNSRVVVPRPEPAPQVQRPQSIQPQVQSRQAISNRQEPPRSSERSAQRGSGWAGSGGSTRGSMASGWNGGGGGRESMRSESRSRDDSGRSRPSPR